MKKYIFILFAILHTVLVNAQSDFFYEVEKGFKNIIDEVEYFDEGTSVWQIGVGFRSNVNLAERAEMLDELDVKFLTPSLSVFYDRNIWNNLGIGVTIGGRVWKVPTFQYQYRYYTGGLRLAYHFDVIEKLDSYLGFGGTFRYMEVSNNESNIHHTQVAPFLLVGARFYYNNKYAVFLEVANDATSWFKTGIAMNISK